MKNWFLVLFFLISFNHCKCMERRSASPEPKRTSDLWSCKFDPKSGSQVLFLKSGYLGREAEFKAEALSRQITALQTENAELRSELCEVRQREVEGLFKNEQGSDENSEKLAAQAIQIASLKQSLAQLQIEKSLTEHYVITEQLPIPEEVEGWSVKKFKLKDGRIVGVWRKSKKKGSPTCMFV